MRKSAPSLRHSRRRRSVSRASSASSRPIGSPGGVVVICRRCRRCRGPGARRSRGRLGTAAPHRRRGPASSSYRTHPILPGEQARAAAPEPVGESGLAQEQGPGRGARSRWRRGTAVPTGRCRWYGPQAGAAGTGLVLGGDDRRILLHWCVVEDVRLGDPGAGGLDARLPCQLTPVSRSLPASAQSRARWTGQLPDRGVRSPPSSLGASTERGCHAGLMLNSAVAPAEAMIAPPSPSAPCRTAPGPPQAGPRDRPTGRSRPAAAGDDTAIPVVGVLPRQYVPPRSRGKTTVSTLIFMASPPSAWIYHRLTNR
ncbi:hypothetical protein RR21198_2527 [Rhodococcus rhodochrous ATCC 21198]|nr:hypothetical protein RR21198_2527 [Rhodococcus rhodochrous ATCC 21198]